MRVDHWPCVLWPLLLVALLLGPIGSARASDQRLSRLSDTPWAYRHYEGARWLTTAVGTRVFSQPTERAFVAFDIPRYRMVYAKPSSVEGWLEVTGAGTRSYPDGTQSMTGVYLTDGKLSTGPTRDRDWYYPQYGFIRASDVLAMDAPEPPLAPDLLTKVPNYWDDLGIEEPRRFAARLDVHPFDALVQISISLGTSRGVCSGFFYGDRTTVATAAHCALKDAKVLVVRKDGTEEVPVRSVKVFDSILVYGADWAIIKLDRAPSTAVGVLLPFDDDLFRTHGAVRSIQIGYGVDLAAVSQKVFGFRAPSLSVCDVLLTQTFVADDYVALRKRDCPTWHGDSGGPLLAWNADRKQFQVIGLESRGETETDARPDYKELVSDERAVKVIIKRVNRLLASIFGSKHKITTIDAATFDWLQPIPNWGAVDHALQASGSGALAKDLSTFSADATAFALGRNGEHPSPTFTVARKRSDKGELDVEQYEFGGNGMLADFIRDACLQHCDASDLDVGKRVSATYGDRLQPPAGNNFVGLKVDEHGRTAFPFALDRVSKERYYFLGGDLFAVNTDDMIVKGIARNFMGLVENGFPEFNRLGCGACENTKTYEQKSDVAPVDALRQADFTAMTPASIPGGTIIDPLAAYPLIRDGKATVISAVPDWLGVPHALTASFAAGSGSFSDDLQGRLSKVLQTATGGDKSRPLIVYCHHSMCWLSYNVALRAIHLGYTDVRWMRGGLLLWSKEKLPLGRVELYPERSLLSTIRAKLPAFFGR